MTQRSKAFENEIVSHIPSLRTFALVLTRNPADADDLLQEGLAKALGNHHQFTPGTNLKAWLVTILRNTFYTGKRKRRREILTAFDGTEDAATVPEYRIDEPQIWTIALGEMAHAMGKLRQDQRDAILMVGGCAMSYDDAAEACGCARGTIKSRVNRGRARLRELLTLDGCEPVL